MNVTTDQLQSEAGDSFTRATIDDHDRTTPGLQQSIIIFVLFVAAATLGLLAPTSAAQAFAKPSTSWSFYISTSDTNSAYNLGCNQGNTDRSTGADSEVVLDFGGQNSSGSGTIRISDGATMTYAIIESIAENFARGYWVCTGSNRSTQLFLDLGTNNSAYQVSGAGGASWANAVNATKNYVEANFGQVAVQGANDIEPSWASYPSTLDWATGFGAHTDRLYLNYGSADGCPTGSHGNGGCNNGWNQYDVWYISYGYGPAITAPEIYYSANARQWAQIARYGGAYQGMGAHYIAPWDEHTLDTATYTSDGAWNALTGNMGEACPLSMEIHWQ
jgi:hypothetical protein